jgi:F-type H+-transporting ATPase subunit b
MKSDCHTRGVRASLRALTLAAVLVLSAVASTAPILAVQEHEAAGAGAEAPHGQTLLQSIAKIVNFAILGGVLFYYLRTPISTYLASRGTQIRQDLVTASEMRAAAAAQLAEIEKKMQALPAELDALKARGAEDVKSEQARIAQAAATERERLIAQTHREIDTRLRMARRQLTEHAAGLAIKLAEERIKRTITPVDQLRLVDRYAAQLRDAQ